MKAIAALSLTAHQVYAQCFSPEMVFPKALQLHAESAHDELAELWSFDWWLLIFGSACVVTFAGIVSGLCVGMASIDHLQLEVKARNSAEVAKSAEKIFPVINQHHWMLVTLLLCNAAALEGLPLMLHKAVPEWVTMIISVVGVVLIGEVIPMSICTGPAQIKIAEFMCPFVKFLMYITAPASYPIAMFLDKLLGVHEVPRYRSDMLSQLVLLHQEDELKKADNLPE